MAKHLKTIAITSNNIELMSRIADRSQKKGLIEKVMTFIGENINEFSNKDDNHLIAVNYKAIINIIV